MTVHPLRYDVALRLESPESLVNSVVVIGDVKRWTSEGRITAALSEFTFIDLDALNAETLLVLQPDIILSPLFCDDFDVVDVATRLLELRFDGLYRAIWCNVPNENIIWSEVRTHAPGLDFDLLLMPSV